MRRRGFLLSVLTCIVLVGSVSLAVGQLTSVKVGHSSFSDESVLYLARDIGIFKKHGLDLTIVDFTGGSKMTQAMVAGSIDIGVGAGTEMAFVAKGAPMTAICETAGPPSFLSIGVPWDSPIRSLDQLKGKRIGVSTAGSLTDWLAKDLARKKGWAR